MKPVQESNLRDTCDYFAGIFACGAIVARSFEVSGHGIGHVSQRKSQGQRTECVSTPEGTCSILQGGNCESFLRRQPRW